MKRAKDFTYELNQLTTLEAVLNGLGDLRGESIDKREVVYNLAAYVYKVWVSI